MRDIFEFLALTGYIVLQFAAVVAVQRMKAEPAAAVGKVSDAPESELRWQDLSAVKGSP